MTNTTTNAQNEQPVPGRAHVYNYAVRVTEIATETLRLNPAAAARIFADPANPTACEIEAARSEVTAPDCDLNRRWHDVESETVTPIRSRSLRCLVDLARSRSIRACKCVPWGGRCAGHPTGRTHAHSKKSLSPRVTIGDEGRVGGAYGRRACPDGRRG